MLVVIVNESMNTKRKIPNATRFKLGIESKMIQKRTGIILLWYTYVFVKTANNFGNE